MVVMCDVVNCKDNKRGRCTSNTVSINSFGDCADKEIQSPQTALGEYTDGVRNDG